MSDTQGSRIPSGTSGPRRPRRRKPEEFGHSILPEASGQPRVDAERSAARDHTPRMDDESEPLSLAEELAEEADLRGRDPQERYERIKQGEIHIAELQKMSMAQLIEEARQENVTDVAGMKKQDLIFRILKERVKMN